MKLFSIAVVLTLLVVACGDDDDDADPTATSPSEGGAPTETRDTGDGGGGEDGDSELIAMGEELYNQQGCAGCHSTDGSTLVGPTWQGLLGKEETLADGSTVTVDAAYLAESIREPNAKVVEGFSEGQMPPYDFTDEQIDAIVAFIGSLSE